MRGALGRIYRSANHAEPICKWIGVHAVGPVKIIAKHTFNNACGRACVFTNACFGGALDYHKEPYHQHKPEES